MGGLFVSVGLLALYWKKEEEAAHLWKLVAMKPTREIKELIDPVPHRAKQLNEYELKEAKTLYSAGASIVELANQFGVHRHTLSEHLRAQGVSIRDARINRDSMMVAERMYVTGSSLASIGRTVGHSPNTVRTHLLRAGVVMRGRHG